VPSSLPLRTGFAFAGLSSAIALTSTAPARADGGAPQLRYDLPVDVTVTVIAGATWFATEAFKASLAPAACRWCDRAGDGSDSLNVVDADVRNALRWSSPGAANTASNLVGFAMVPLASMGVSALAARHDGRTDTAFVDGLVVLEAAALAADVNQAVKLVVGRERPFVHVLNQAEKSATAQPSDNNLSFFSGHTTFTFALASAAGTVASMRGYRWAPLVWSMGLTLATATGYLRIAADRHYFSDVMTGAIVGAGVGIAVPYLFHRPASTDATGSATGFSAAPLSFGTKGISFAGAF
jgi:membrane-associated phospholipid phosphatase